MRSFEFPVKIFSQTSFSILNRMILVYTHNFFVLLNILSFILTGLPSSLGEMIDNKVLNVGEELRKETLPLQMGSCLYQLEGLKSHTWYEVKISYPASIPSSFSLLLTRGNSSSGPRWKRKLLNTEKLIFKTDNLELSSNQGGMYVLVTVEPAGVVAIPHVEERKEVIFNIVCEELLLGIPFDAWGVVMLVLLCLVLAFAIPYFLPSYLVSMNRGPESAGHIISKDS